MCGRYVRRTPLQHVLELFGALPDPPEMLAEPSYNVAPTQYVPAVRLGNDGQRRIVLLKWGLIPAWANDPAIGNRMINARAETVADKPAFRDAFRRRRCILPADGFYEWKRDGRHNQPYYIHRADDQPFGLAGLWERWAGGPEVIESCTILTTSPNDLMRPIHDRMPVILSAADYDPWLDPRSDLAHLASLLGPFPDGELATQPVSPYVNDPKHNDQKCLLGSGPAAL
jgi:putative SOS response-associated peptidase YedK